jgi:hypothetical protein
MLFSNHSGRVLAISQPAHALISGQVLAAWHVPLDPSLLLAAAQHDIGWLDWECAPSFDPGTGRPHLFRDVGAATHAPMWARGVERACHAWGARPALLISRHGGVIYRRYTDRHRISQADAAAADRFLHDQAAKEAAWAACLGLTDDILAHDTALIALSDSLSLAFCGELATPIDTDAPDLGPIRVTALDNADDPHPAFTLTPWPFRHDTVAFETEALALPEPGRFDDEAAMRRWLADPSSRVPFHVTARKLD